ncbi:hypothetical protein RclHR1_07750005 [Rhizophagus clarus]|nr:hypothetical protein RclHR1_07750005 [Rhizophagus clarus]
MIMYFVATGRQPFDDRAHYHRLDICNENRHEINEQETPKNYINLMKESWNLNPKNRPIITESIELICTVIARKSEIEEAVKYRNLQLTFSCQREIDKLLFIIRLHTSQLLNPFTKDLDSKCLDCAIID